MFVSGAKNGPLLVSGSTSGVYVVRNVGPSVSVVPHGERWLYVTKGPRIAIEVR